MRIINFYAVVKNYVNAFLAYKKEKNKDVKNQNFDVPKNVIVIDMFNSHIYSRFFYILIKFFSLSGYAIYFPNYNFSYYRKHFHNKAPNNYYKLLFDEQLLIFNIPPKNANIILTLRDDHFNPDYFSPLFLNKNSEKEFFIPMPMHPNFYHMDIWNEPINQTTMKNKSIFMVGNFDKKQYSRLKKTPFKIETRIEVYEYLKVKPYFKTFKYAEDLNEFIENPTDHNVILIDSRDVRIPIVKLRETLNMFTFFLALPGLVKPLSHNLIEAISTGAIPIIHKTYSKAMVPNLEHMHNAIIYDDLKDLDNKIDLAFNLDEETISTMRHEIITYYNLNLTPDSVIKNITSGKFNLFYLQTIQIGVKNFQSNYISS